MKTKERVLSARLILKVGRYMEYAGRLGISVGHSREKDNKNGGTIKNEES